MPSDIRSTAQKKDDKGRVRHGGEWLAIWSDPDSLKSDAERRSEAALDRKILARQLALAAAVRSISGMFDLEVRFGADAADGIVALPFPQREGKDRQAIRGDADAQATFLRFHDPQRHAASRPKGRVAARIFDVIERARCHGLGAAGFAGVEANLIAHQIADLERRDLMNAHLASLVPINEALRMVLRDVFANRHEASIQTAGLRNWDRWLRDRYAAHFDNMAARMADQTAFADAALVFIDALLAELPSGGEIDRRLSPTAPDGSQDDADGALREAENRVLADLREPGETDAPDDPDAQERATRKTTNPPQPYTAFTTMHDRVVNAAELADRATLNAARKALDERQAEFRRDVARLSLRLQRTLLARQTRQWEFDQDEGLIDASRLDRVIVKPGFASCYKHESANPFLDTVVTLLIDNSGSMRGKHIETACVVVDLLAAALERCSVATEVLGFTTCHWKGGLSYKEWVAAGRPENPGRLNDLLHVVYKDAQTPLRRARDALCAMLTPGILKENIDGEAVLWAASRLVAHPEQRRILIVVSDGAPVDQATLDANSDDALLFRHLQDSIAWVDRETNIELSAIGLKHDLGELYQRSVKIEDSSDLGRVLVDALDTMLGEHRKGRSG